MFGDLTTRDYREMCVPWYKDCGHPCESSNIHLRDGEGKDHLVLADMVGCFNL